MDEPRRIDAPEAVLAWGDPAQLKAELRGESLARHLRRPLEERLRTALELVRRNSDQRARR